MPSNHSTASSIDVDLDEVNALAPKQVVEIIFDDEEEEVIRAARYIYLKEQGSTIEEIAHEFGWSSRTSVYKWADKWKKSGALDKARQKYLQPKIESIHDAVSKVLDHWPAILARVARTALSSPSDRVALEAAAWLKANVVDPAMEGQQQEGAAEQQYAKSKQNLLPNVIVAPKFLTKSADASGE